MFSKPTHQLRSKKLKAQGTGEGIHTQSTRFASAESKNTRTFRNFRKVDCAFVCMQAASTHQAKKGKQKKKRQQQKWKSS